MSLVPVCFWIRPKNRTPWCLKRLQRDHGTEVCFRLSKEPGEVRWSSLETDSTEVLHGLKCCFIIAKTSDCLFPVLLGVSSCENFHMSGRHALQSWLLRTSILFCIVDEVALQEGWNNDFLEDSCPKISNLDIIFTLTVSSSVLLVRLN